MRTPHEHAELIKAWAYGAEIEFHSHDDVWFLVTKPEWDIEQKYRIKPEPKPDVVEDVFVWKSPRDLYPRMVRHNIPNLRLIFDGESGLFKDAEVLE